MSNTEYIVPNETPFCVLEASKAFEALSLQEKVYAYHLSRASYFGSLIILFQTSIESPNIFRLVSRIHRFPLSTVRERALKFGLTEEEFTSYSMYVSTFLSNMGNYKGFGSTKVIPNLPLEKFESLINSTEDEICKVLWNSVKDSMYELSDKCKQLGLGSSGVTKYFSENCSQEDADLGNRFMKSQGIEGYINRFFKMETNGKKVYEIRNAGVVDKHISETEFEGVTFKVSTGDYGPLLSLVNKHLEKAISYASNEMEKKMLTEYIQSFETGSLTCHKDGSRHWIKNKGPVVEFYIGFIETYRDPVGMRGEFEGFVSIVNKEQSRKFTELVNGAEKLLSYLPWPKEFEKDVFLRPDFTSLDVLTFASSGVPSGINIPNYDEIRQSEGFKNVSLGNVILSSFQSDKPTSFLSSEDDKLYKKYNVQAFEIQVGLHELLGHGSGKLFQKDAANQFNFPSGLINPETGVIIDKYYELGETYDSVFTSLGSSYEECRAEAIGLYLSTFEDSLKIFGFENSNSDVVYVNWLSLLLSALKGLEMYSVTKGEWMQAHAQARFVILNVLLEAKENFVTVRSVNNSLDGKPDLLLSLDKSKLESIGKPALGSFLRKLQVYKSSADIESARSLYSKYSCVSDSGNIHWASWRPIVIDRKQPRKIFVQGNLLKKDTAEDDVIFKNYEASSEGYIQSWNERFSDDEKDVLDKILDELHTKELTHFTFK